MKKIISILLILAMIMAAVGCSNGKKDGSKTTTESVSKDDDGISQQTTSVTQEQKPTETTTQEQEADAPIVNDLGGVDFSEVKMIADIFEEVVKKLREDGIVKSSDVCVSMKDTTILVDITFDNDDTDLKLDMDKSTGIYTLTLDSDFTWLEGFGETINGKDPATYNKELLLKLLGVILSDPNVVFDRIDMDYHSAAALSYTEWTEVGNYFIICNDEKPEGYFSYKISHEPVN